MTKAWLVKKAKEEVFVDVMGARVYLKPLKYGKSREALSLALKIDPVTGKPDMDTGLLATMRALHQIRSWDITDEEDQPLPVSLATLDELDEGFVEALITKVAEKGQEASEVSPVAKKQ